MELLITTQYVENYGTRDEPVWKSKGGDDYIVRGDIDSNTDCEAIVEKYRASIEYANDIAREKINGYRLVPNEYVTQYELSQIEYDGRILFPAKRFTMETPIETV